MRLTLCLVAGKTNSEPKRKKSFFFRFCLVCLEKTNEWNNIPYETRIRYKIQELENKRKSWYLSFFSLGDEVGSNFDIICKEEAREETTIGIPFSQFVKVDGNWCEWYIFQFKGWMDCHALLLNMKSWLRIAGESKRKKKMHQKTFYSGRVASPKGWKCLKGPFLHSSIELLSPLNLIKVCTQHL